MSRISDNGVDRDMTADELAAHKQVVADSKKYSDAQADTLAAQAAAKASAQAKLAALGLTADEIAAL